MKTPLQLALEQLHGAPLTADITPAGAMRLWAQLFAPTFFGLFLCCAIAIAGTLLLWMETAPRELQPMLQFFGVMLLAGLYCVGNILLIQGLPGARAVHSLLLAALTLLVFASLLIQPPGKLLLTSLCACLAGQWLCNSKRYRSMQALHGLIRQLRRKHQPLRRKR